MNLIRERRAFGWNSLYAISVSAGHSRREPAGEDAPAAMRRRGTRFRRRLWLLAVPVAMLPASGRAPALAGGSELIVNGLLAEGADGTPLGWRYQSYFPDSDAEKYSWDVDPAGIGTLKIVHIQMSDSRWIQDFPVSPRTWYHVSGWVRTEMVGPPAAIGAHLSIAENGYSSDDVRGTAGWRQVGFWMKTAKDQKSLEL